MKRQLENYRSQGKRKTKLRGAITASAAAEWGTLTLNGIPSGEMKLEARST